MTEVASLFLKTFYYINVWFFILFKIITKKILNLEYQENILVFFIRAVQSLLNINYKLFKLIKTRYKGNNNPKII
jgi:hypothetical protein